MAHLRPCTGCQRHVRAHETRCPFCDVELEAVASLPARGSNVPLTRAAILFASATAVAACTGGSDPGPSSSTSSGGSSSGGSTSSGTVALYAPAPVDDGGDTTKDSGGPVALYGPAPVQDGG